MSAKRILTKTALVVAVLFGAYVVVYETFLNDFSGMNHYQVLGVDQEASLADIKKSFRSLSVKYHPDKSGTALHNRRFEKISEAYTVLSSSIQRGIYDTQLAYERQARAIRNKWMGPREWRDVLVGPTDWSPKAIALYVLELPSMLWPLLCEWISLEYLIASLILLGTCLFVVDLVARLVWQVMHLVIWRPLCWLWPWSTYQSQQRVASVHLDESLRAARMRQQQALDAESRRYLRPKGRHWHGH